MKSRRVFGLLCCTVLMLLTAFGLAAEASHPFFFLIMTDPQLGMYGHDQDLSLESENLKKFVTVANRLHPAFIVVCGDLVNRAGDPTEIERYRAILSTLNPDIVVYSVAGNHDVKNQPTSESLAAYRRIFGPDHYSFSFLGFEAIVLNSGLIKDPQFVAREAEEQRAWLADELAEAHRTGKDVVIFQHVPWFLHSPGEADNYSNLPLSQRQEYLNRFAAAGVHYIFAGHLHDSAFGNEGQIAMRTVGALGKPLGKTPSGFGMVVVQGHELRYTYYSIDEPPSEVH